MKECMITAEMVQTIIRKRKREIHKGHCGRILLAAGSKGMMGAAVLSCRGALRSGAGLVQLAVPENLFPVAQAAVPEATCRPRSFSAGDLSRYDAVAAGPGLGTGAESVETVRYLLKLYEGPLVLDADALNVIADPANDLLSLVRNRKGETVITPHLGEARRLLLCGGADGQADGAEKMGRTDLASRLVKLTGCVTVLKGAGTIVATPAGDSYTNTTGNPGMATGGSGDVLTGMITGLWGQRQPDDGGGFRRLSAWEAAVCGVFLHGLAGDLAAEELGEYGMIAGDLAAKIPDAIRSVLTE
ncbi:MAG: NAD(P)H-hydrate dehydratase [Firmicutes bacterium]|nr:NAD(P)H-hydrate dehydratase [Bacillota bacterium]